MTSEYLSYTILVRQYDILFLTIPRNLQSLFTENGMRHYCYSYEVLITADPYGQMGADSMGLFVNIFAIKLCRNYDN